MSEIFSFSEGPGNQAVKKKEQKTYTISQVMQKHHQIKAINRVGKDDQPARLFITHL